MGILIQFILYLFIFDEHFAKWTFVLFVQQIFNKNVKNFPANMISSDQNTSVCHESRILLREVVQINRSTTLQRSNRGFAGWLVFF